MSVCIHVSAHATTNKQWPIHRQDRVSREGLEELAREPYSHPPSAEREELGYRCKVEVHDFEFATLSTHALLTARKKIIAYSIV